MVSPELKDPPPWADDDGPPDDPDLDEDTSVSGNDHIYQIDGPGFGDKWRTPEWDYLCQIANFREYVKVKIGGTWYQCSDYFKWHSKLYTKPKNPTFMTRDWAKPQVLGDGWVTVPESP